MLQQVIFTATGLSFSGAVLVPVADQTINLFARVRFFCNPEVNNFIDWLLEVLRRPHKFVL